MEKTSAAQLVLTRVLDAPVEMVYKVWTEAKHLAHWWGPKGAQLKIKTFELKPGGTFHYGLTMPDGLEMWGLFTFREMQAPNKLVYVSSFADADANIIGAPWFADWPKEILNILTLEESNGKTKLTLTGHPINATVEEESRYRSLFSSMEEGFGGTFEQLENYLASL